MKYSILACDYDGTLATGGVILAETRAALERLRASGRKLIMVTGRELTDLSTVCPDLALFDRIVAENGALLFHPASGVEKPLGEPPPAEFIAALRRSGANPLSVGRVIVSTWEPYEVVALELIRAIGLELQVIFNKGAVMILPSGINKATGLAAALLEIGISPQQVVAVGDAENDHALLSLCEVGVAVANATPHLKEQADLVTVADHGAGVAELIDRILADDLAGLEPRRPRHDVQIATVSAESAEARAIPPR